MQEEKREYIKKASWILCLIVLLCTIILMLVCYKTFLGRALFFLLSCSLLSLVRVFLGPSSADRAVALMIVSMLIIGFCGILSMFMQTDWYIDIAFIWTVQSFIVSLCLAKFLEGRRFGE